MYRLSDRQIAALLVVYVLALAAWLLLNEVRVTLEDGFYYFGVARHLAQGDGFTFDGLNPTNGYHPLWLFILAPLFWITTTPRIALTLGLILQALLLSGAVILIYYTARRWVGRLEAGLAALLWTFLTYPVALGGLEFGLHALGILAVAYIYLRCFAEALPERFFLYFLLGILLSLTFLARLDTILLAGIVSLWLSWGEYKRGISIAGIVRLLAFGIPLLLVSLIYFGHNLYIFGHLPPVSSVVKRNWSAYLLSQDPVYVAYGWLVAKLYQLAWPLYHLDQPYMVSMLFGTFGYAAFWFINRVFKPWGNWPGQFIQCCAPFILFSLANFFSYSLLYHDYLSFPAWYYVIQPWLTVLLLAIFTDRAWIQRGYQSGRSARQQMVMAMMVLLICGVTISTVWGVEQWRLDDQQDIVPQPLYDGATWVKHNVPADAIIGAWNAGAIGYLSERQVINLDGLVNSWDYHQVDRYDLCRYWRKMGITYLVDIFDLRSKPNQAIAPDPPYPYYAHCAGQIELIWADDRNHDSWWRLAAYRIKPQ